MKHTQLLNAQLNVEDTKELSGKEEPKKLIEHFKLERSPFTMIKQNEEYFVTIGNYLLTGKHSSWEEAEYELEDNKWNIILSLITIAAEKLIEDNNKIQNGKPNQYNSGMPNEDNT